MVDRLIEIRDFSAAFDLVLNGFRVPFQLRQFTFKLCLLASQSDKPVSISDDRLAEQMGNTSRNYICKLRRKLRDFQNEIDEFGKRPIIVSITEATYDHKKKRPRPTEYQFSRELLDLIFDIVAAARNNPNYHRNFYSQIRSTIAEHRPRLNEIGYYNPRKLRRDRSPDQLLGTELLRFERQIQRLFEQVKRLGFDTADLGGFLSEYFPQIVAREFYEQIFEKGPSYDRTKNFERFIVTALDYVKEKTFKPETVYPKKWSKKAHDTNWSFSQQLDNHAGAADLADRRKEFAEIISRFVFDQRYLLTREKVEAKSDLVFESDGLRVFRLFEPTESRR